MIYLQAISEATNAWEGSHGGSRMGGSGVVAERQAQLGTRTAMQVRAPRAQGGRSCPSTGQSGSRTCTVEEIEEARGFAACLSPAAALSNTRLTHAASEEAATGGWGEVSAGVVH